MTPSQELADKIKTHLLNGGMVRFANYGRAMFLSAKHAAYVEGSRIPTDNGVYVRSGKSRNFWFAHYISFSKMGG